MSEGNPAAEALVPRFNFEELLNQGACNYYNLSIPANPCMTPNSKRQTNKQPPPPTNASVLPRQN